MSSTVTHYDFKSKLENQSWSPLALRTHLALNFKNIPFRTEWVEYPDIEAVSTALGIQPTEQRDGKPLHTLPIVHDPSANRTITDTYDIVVYLDKQYPTEPQLIPAGTEEFHRTFAPLIAVIGAIHLMRALEHMNPPTADYLRRKRENQLGIKLEEISPLGSEKRAGQLKAFHDELDTLAKKIDENGGKYYLGASPSYADFKILAPLVSMKLFVGEDSEEWKEVQNSRWGAYFDSLAKYL